MPWTPDEYAEHFEPKGKRESRQDRKIRTAKDRSKYKKTDVDKQTELPTTPNQAHVRGRVLSIKSEGILVDLDGKTHLCTLRGVFKKEKTKQKTLVAVGDFAHVLITAPGEGCIMHIESRTSHLSRAETLTHTKQQILAANIDQVLILTSILTPPLKPTLIDRYLIAAQKGNMAPAIIINKIDYLNNPPQHIDAQTLEDEKVLYDEIIAAYSKLGFPLICTSAQTGEGIDELTELMKNKTSVFSGQSGVGKSSLINAAFETDLLTQDVKQKTGKGTHTTTAAHLIPLGENSFVVDTPGVKSFGIWDIDARDVQRYFPDIHEISHNCQFPDCSHSHEPGCAVKTALDTQKLSPLRFDSYSALMTSIGEKHKPR